MADILEQLAEKLKQALGAELVSVILYGSAASGDRQEKFSDYNVLCVLNRLTPRELAATETVFRWWNAQGNPAPLLLTAQEVASSTDCFAIEFHDIKESHRLLYGADVVSALTVENTYYRAQVERELRAKLLRVRQKASAILSDNAALRQLLADSVSTFCVLFRHALILHGEKAPVKKREIIARAKERFGLDAAPFLSLLDLREQKVKAKEMEPGAVLAAYLTEIGKVIDAVDALEKTDAREGVRN